MKKQTDILKIAALTGVVATLAVGCASSGYARVDDGTSDYSSGAGVSAGAEVGTDADLDVDVDADADLDRNYRSSADLDEGVPSPTVTAMSFTAVTDARQQNKWMFDPNVQFRAIETYTFAVPDPELSARASSDLPEFSVNLPPGSVYVEAAGGAGESRVGRVVQHSPNPR